MKRGHLLRMKPYQISNNGENGIRVVLSELSGLAVGDKVFQEKLENGIIMLIPEKLYENLEKN